PRRLWLATEVGRLDDRSPKGHGRSGAEMEEPAMRRLQLLLVAAVVGVSLATPVDAQQITPTGPLAVLPGSTDFYSLTIANFSEDQSIWLDSLTIDPVSVPGEGTMTVALSLPNVLPEPPSGFLPPPGLTVAPGGTLVLDQALVLTVPETAVVG